MPPLLRIVRKMDVDQKAQAPGNDKQNVQDPYLVAPQVKSHRALDDNRFEYVLRYAMREDASRYVEGTLTYVREDGKIAIYYDFTPSDNLVSKARIAELGLALYAAGCRVCWVGDGPLASVPGKSKTNVFGLWAMHKDDNRFPGNRSGVKWVEIGWNAEKGDEGKRKGTVNVLESGTGNVSFENIGGDIYLTENMAVAGCGGKSSGQDGMVSPADIKMKGCYRIYEADAPAERPKQCGDCKFL